MIVQEEAVSIGPAAVVDPVIWTARLRTGRVVIFRASGSRDFRAAALIALAVVVDLAAGTGSVAEEDLGAVALAALAVVAVAVFAAAVDSGADDEINVLNQAPIFL